MCDDCKCKVWFSSNLFGWDIHEIYYNTGEYSYKNPSASYVLDNETKDQLAAQAMVQFWGDDYIRNFSLGGLGLSLKRATTKGNRILLPPK